MNPFCPAPMLDFITALVCAFVFFSAVPALRATAVDAAVVVKQDGFLEVSRSESDAHVSWVMPAGSFKQIEAFDNTNRPRLSQRLETQT